MPPRFEQIQNKRHRIMKARAAYRDKNRGVPPLRPKCRVVIIGCGDPDLKQLSRDSPTPSRISELLIVCIASAGAKSLVQQRWLPLEDGFSLMLRKLFLQGEQDASERSGPIYMESPRDAILTAANAYPSPLYQITGKLLWIVQCTQDLVQKGRQRFAQLQVQAPQP